MRNLEDSFQLKGVTELLSDKHRGGTFADQLISEALEGCLIYFCITL